MKLLEIDDERLRANRLLREKADRQVGEGRIGDAIESLASAVELHPADDDSALLVAYLAAREGRGDQALEFALKAAEQRAIHPAAWNLIGTLLSSIDDSTRARRAFAHALEQAPRFRAAKRNLREFPRFEAIEIASRELLERVDRSLKQQRSTLDACVVVGPDDAAVVAETLDSLEGKVDRVRLICAGLSPELLELPDDASIEVVSLSWNGDLVTLWNLALELATAEWSLLLRAGDRLPTDWSAVECEMARRRRLAVAIPFGGTYCFRLLRNAPGLRFAGVAWAEISTALHGATEAWGLTPGHVDAAVAVAHDPWPALNEGEAEVERRWATELLGTGKARASALLLLARLDLLCGDDDSAIERARSARESFAGLSIDATGLIEHAAVIEAQALAAAGRYDTLDAMLEQYLRDFDACAAIRFHLGVAAKALDDDERAFDALQAAVDGVDRPAFAPLPAAMRDGRMEKLLAATLLDLGGTDEAREQLTQVVERFPSDIDARIGLATIELATEQFGGFLAELDALVDRAGDDPRAWLDGGRLLERLPTLGPTAVEWYEAAVTRHPERRDLACALARAQVRAGALDDAAASWSELEPRQIDDRAACWLTELDGQRASGEALSPDLREEVVRWLEQWALAGLERQLERSIETIHSRADEWPELDEAVVRWLRQARG